MDGLERFIAGRTTLRHRPSAEHGAQGRPHRRARARQHRRAGHVRRAAGARRRLRAHVRDPVRRRAAAARGVSRAHRRHRPGRHLSARRSGLGLPRVRRRLPAPRARGALPRGHRRVVLSPGGGDVQRRSALQSALPGRRVRADRGIRHRLVGARAGRHLPRSRWRRRCSASVAAPICSSTSPGVAGCATSTAAPAAPPTSTPIPATRRPSCGRSSMVAPARTSCFSVNLIRAARALPHLRRAHRRRRTVGCRRAAWSGSRRGRRSSSSAGRSPSTPRRRGSRP